MVFLYCELDKYDNSTSDTPTFSLDTAQNKLRSYIMPIETHALGFQTCSRSPFLSVNPGNKHTGILLPGKGIKNWIVNITRKGCEPGTHNRSYSIQYTLMSTTNYHDLSTSCDHPT